MSIGNTFRTIPIIGKCIVLGLLFKVNEIMAADINLKWEWPVGRAPVNQFIVKILKISDFDAGFLGIRKSPSFANSFPDPVVIDAIVFDADKTFINKSISLTLPKVEMSGVDVSNYVVLGVIDDNTCICLKKIEYEAPNLAHVTCP